MDEDDGQVGASAAIVMRIVVGPFDIGAPDDYNDVSVLVAEVGWEGVTISGALAWLVVASASLMCLGAKDEAPREPCDDDM